MLQKRSGRLRSATCTRRHIDPLWRAGDDPSAVVAAWAIATGAAADSDEIPVGSPTAVSSATCVTSVRVAPVRSSWR